MIMTPSKTGVRQSDPESPAAPEWTAVLRKIGDDTSSARLAFGKSQAWWDRVANIIAGRR